MKDFEVKAPVEHKILHEQQQEKKVQFAGSLNPHRGHTLFEINKITGEIRPAAYQDIVLGVGPNGQPKVSRKVVMKKDCLYKSCLNEKNARRHFESYKRKYGLS